MSIWINLERIGNEINGQKIIRLYNNNSDILMESNTSCTFASFPNVSDMKQMDRNYHKYHNCN